MLSAICYLTHSTATCIKPYIWWCHMSVDTPNFTQYFTVCSNTIDANRKNSAMPSTADLLNEPLTGGNSAQRATSVKMCHGVIISYLNTLRPRQNGHHFADDIFKWVFVNRNVWIAIKISLKFVPKDLINNIPALVQKMAWRRPGDKP